MGIRYQVFNTQAKKTKPEALAPIKQGNAISRLPAAL
jgi:hypothetical protein